MYSLMLRKDFIAQHFLIGGDWGEENQLHSHAYTVEVRLSAEKLDEHGYLVDLDELEIFLNACITYFKNKILNDLPEFKGINPSIENLAFHFHKMLLSKFKQHCFAETEVRIWENDQAWASYKESHS